VRKIPVFSGERVIEFADEARARQLLTAPNAKAVRRRKDRQIVGVELEDLGGNWKEPALHGNPRQYSHDHETDRNPARVWTLRHLSDETQDLFQLAVTDTLGTGAG